MIVETLQNLADFFFVTQGITEVALIKFSLWLLTFFIVFKGSEKVFGGNRAVPLLVAVIISFIGIRFMPDEWIDTMSAVYGIVVGIALFLGPYILISIIADAARLGRTIKWILVVIAYGALIYFLPAFGVLEFESSILDWMLRYFADNRFVAVAAFIIILGLFIMLRRRIYRGAGYGARGTRRFLGWVGIGGAAGTRAIGRGAASGARYLGEGAAFGAGAAGGYGWRRSRTRYRWFRRMMYRRRQRQAAEQARRQAQQGIMRGGGEGI